jgi:eukaryotic-like serine/threonine-protein kinase
LRTLDDIQPGLVLGRYEFLLPIAKGGMAAVWAARAKGARGFQKIVAVKTILPALSDNTEFERMFLDEARTASRVRHPNVAEIIDLGEQEDVLYLVMEWIDGESLATVLRSVTPKHSGIPIPIAVKIMADAAQGLHAAHQLKDDQGVSLGLVHRDVSPQNILLSYEGIVKLVDFGVAKAAGRLSASTAKGQLKGKIPFMAPEQVVGHDLDRRTDVFAMGTLLYQLTTGKHPFRGGDNFSTMTHIAHRNAAPPRTVASGEYPELLEEIVMRALERDPRKRFQTAAEMWRALDEVFVRGTDRASTDDVAAFLTDLLGQKRDEWRQRLKAAIVAADQRADGGAPAAVAKAAAPAESPAPAEPSVSLPKLEDPSTQTSAGVAATADGAARKSRRALVLLLGLSAVLILVMLWRLVRRVPDALVGPASVEAAESSAPAVPALPSAAVAQESLPAAVATAAVASSSPARSVERAATAAPRGRAPTVAPTGAPTTTAAAKKPGGVDTPDF